LGEERMAKVAAARVARSAMVDEGAAAPVDLSELSDLLGYALKRAQLKLYEDFLKCVAPLQLTPAQFSVLMLLEKNPGRNQTEVAGALGILRPNFVAMLDSLESRGLCVRGRSATDRRSHVLSLTEKGRQALARARKIIAAKHEARLGILLGSADRAALLRILTKIAQEF
jgi:DNA-binding MarR family transcriptional regulator